MSDGVTIDVRGVQKLARDLNLKNAAVVLEAAGVIKDATTFTRDLARELAPVGPTGDLSRGIGMTGRGLTRTVRPNVPYAKFVEFGTYTRGGPQPFLYPAADRGEDKLIRGLLDVAAKGI